MTTQTNLSKRIERASAHQNKAANPEVHAWVLASAGTGKTTVLVARFIRLILNGTPPDKILCLTYTKAAATQMKERILSRVGGWVSLSDQALEQELTKLLNQSPSSKDILRARSLFGDLLDQMDRLNILTIHSFCHSLLSRFPFEADIETGAEMLDDTQAKTMLQSCLHDLLKRKDLDYIDHLSQYTHDQNWLSHFDVIIDQRAMFRDFFRLHGDDYQNAIYKALSLPSNPPTPQDYLNDILADDQLPKEVLYHLTILKPDKKDIINNILTGNPLSKYILYNNYCNCFLTREFTPLKKFPKFESDTLKDQFKDEQLRLLDAHETLKSIETAHLTHSLCALSKDLLELYNARKSEQNLLDFHDLIEKTLQLLAYKDAAEWIKYKLDGGLEHVLVDEAQDTGPMQWRIIRHLIEDYFSGLSTDIPRPRTVFAVGDIKQSIFGFQGADPQSMLTYHDAFEQTAKQAKQAWDNIPLDTSFRTAQDILDIVDIVSPNAWGQTEHLAGKAYPGRVELWPSIGYERQKTKAEPWAPPQKDTTNNKQKLIEDVADHIAYMLAQKIAIPSKNDAPVEASDILILVKNRTHYPQSLIQALRKRNIPISGLDRFNLNEDPSIKTITNLMNWISFRYDDLSLATILKSPLIGWNDDQLSKLAYGRVGTIWDALKRDHKDIATWLDGLTRLLNENALSQAMRVLLDAPCPIGQSALTALQRRYGPSCIDSLEQWLDFLDAMPPEQNTLLNALYILDNHDFSIKRQLEGENATGVRIMTVHGAKGLEAPLVYLIDTLFTSVSIDRAGQLQWIESDKGQVPLWAPNKNLQASTLSDAIDDAKFKERQEYFRLLYVAMTRAKDGLFIMGAHPHVKADEQSWYHLINDAMNTANIKTDNDRKIYGSWDLKPSVKIYENNNINTIKKAIVFERPVTQKPPVTLSSSELDIDQTAASIGTQWHLLCERAMIYPSNIWHNKIEKWCIDLPDIKPAIALEKLNAVRADQKYGYLFDDNGAVEVPFVTKDGTNGRIDRLVETDDAVWIIDYKTGLDDADDALRQKYHTQLTRYKNALKPVYNDKEIRILLVDIIQTLFVELD